MPVNIRVITASAGTGKTTALARILDDAIGEGRVRVDGIVATTFTRQAAAELIERARTRLLAHGRGHEAHQLLAARIGTVNSVCGALVADFAFELGLSPALRVLDESGAELEQRRALAQVVGEQRGEELSALVRAFTNDLDWHHEVRRVIESARANGLDAAALGGCARRSIESLDRCLGPCAPDGGALERALAAAIETALAALARAPDGRKNTAEYVECMRTAARELERGRHRWGSWAKLGTEKPSVKVTATVAPVVAAAARHVEHPRMRAQLHRFIELVFAVAADGLAAYQDHKRERGVIDFVDQEALALTLLRRPDVREALAGRFELVLVDEFQDTSPLQLAIFLELASLARESVWVGDQKQAIYGFRGTDPKLMDAVIDSLTFGTNDPELVDRTMAAVGPRGVMETLSTSFRSRPGLVALTSDVFAPAFARHGLEEERTRLHPHLTAAEEPRGLGPFVEHWPLVLDGRSSKVKLAAALAGGIKRLLDDAPRVRPRTGPGTRVATAGDVAILCRTNEQCQAVADALAALGIPAVVPRLGLLETAEGRVVVAGLRLWVDPRDALARAELARLGTHAEDLDGLVTHALAAAATRELPFADEPAVAALLARHAREPELDPVATVTAIIDATDLRARAAGWGEPAQRQANLDALRAHAAAYVAEARARREAVTVVGLLAYLDGMVEGWGWRATRTDAQALLGDADAVTISTWHAAKGREWPITVLYGLEQLREPSAVGLHVESEAARFDLDAPLAGRWLRYWPFPYNTGNQRGPVRERYDASPECAEVAARSRREALRLLYVGWTRARDRLVLAAEEGKLLGGLAGTLVELTPGALTEPAADAGDVAVRWGGRRVTVAVRPAEAAPPVEATRAVGEVTVGSAVADHPPLRFLPSEAPARPCVLGEPVLLGAPLAVRGSPDMLSLGQAVHAFLAADRAGGDPAGRQALATAVLDRHGVAGHLAPADLVEAATRLWTWLECDVAATRLHREWPLAHRLASGTLVGGLADLVARTPAGLALLDHKTLPGSLARALTVLPGYSGQLAAYADALAAATGLAVASTWLHLPLQSALVQVTVLPAA